MYDKIHYKLKKKKRKKKDLYLQQKKKKKTVHFVKSKGRIVNEDGGGEGDRIYQCNEAERMVQQEKNRPRVSPTTA